jgi:hypothetical protein
VEYAPSRPLMRSLLSQFQTPTTPRRAVGFFGSGHSPGHPGELITQLNLDWLRFILALFVDSRQHVKNRVFDKRNAFGI